MKNIGDPSLTFVDGFTMKGLHGIMYVGVNGQEDVYDLDDCIGWIYRQGIVGIMFRTPENKGCAQVRFSKEDCAELVRKLTKMLQKVDDSHKPA